MAYHIMGYQTNPITGETIFSILCDTVADLPSSPVSDNGYGGEIGQGSKAFVIAVSIHALARRATANLRRMLLRFHAKTIKLHIAAQIHCIKSCISTEISVKNIQNSCADLSGFLRMIGVCAESDKMHPVISVRQLSP